MGIKHLPSRRAYRLARDYALGTLHGPARRRFDALQAQDRRLAEEVERWRGRLSALSWLRPERRPARFLPALGGFKRGLWNNLGFWRGLALAASLSAVAVSAWAWQQAQERPVYVAVLAAQGGTGSWLVRAGTRSASLSLRPMTPQQAIDGDYELWLVPKSGKPCLAEPGLRLDSFVDEFYISRDPRATEAQKARFEAVFGRRRGGAVGLTGSGQRGVNRQGAKNAKESKLAASFRPRPAQGRSYLLSPRGGGVGRGGAVGNQGDFHAVAVRFLSVGGTRIPALRTFIQGPLRSVHHQNRRFRQLEVRCLHPLARS